MLDRTASALAQYRLVARSSLTLLTHHPAVKGTILKVGTERIDVEPTTSGETAVNTQLAWLALAQDIAEHLLDNLFVKTLMIA